MTTWRESSAGPISALPVITLTSGSLEALKWLGLVLMALDHVNKYLLHASVPALFYAGRAVLPIFAIVLAYNLARPGTLERGVYLRVMTRLAGAGALATAPFIALDGLGWGWWPLNIMFMLLVATGVMYLVERGTASRVLAVGLFVIGGALVEFWWPALTIAVGAWSYFRRPNWTALLFALAGLFALYVFNKNLWALAALPLIVLASRVDLPVPRMRWVFYAFYPLHLAVIWMARGA
ncbi:MAG: TraX family protein [Caldimonas sp.]